MDVRDVPWLEQAFQTGLASLQDGVVRAAQSYAAEMGVLARLAAWVPREPFDERGATPWTSFTREVAVARCASDRQTAFDVRAARRLAGRGTGPCGPLAAAGPAAAVVHAEPMAGEAGAPAATSEVVRGDGSPDEKTAAAVVGAGVQVEVHDAAQDEGPADPAAVLPALYLLLRRGAVSVGRAQAFLRAVDPYDDALATKIDAVLAERVPRLSAWRIEQDVRRQALLLDPDVEAQRAAASSAGRLVDFLPGPDGQATVSLCGPALPLARWFQTVDARARALRQAGDGRCLAALRFDVAVGTFPCASHSAASHSVPAPTPAAGTVPAGSATVGTPTGMPAAGATPAALAGSVPAGSSVGSAPRPSDARSSAPPGGSRGVDAADLACWREAAAGGLHVTGLPPAPRDCRMSRPAQVLVTVPVETALGLSNDPAWLDGYGWIDAPTARLLLPDAELRRVCVQSGTGVLVDVVEGAPLRPPPTPAGTRTALVAMVLNDVELTDISYREERQHDPSDALALFVRTRDLACDGPTGSRTRARDADLDHDIAYPTGPTAAWNLVARGRRTHLLKHAGWTPLRTPTSTIWTSPAGQLVEVPRQAAAPAGIDRHQAQAPDEDCSCGSCWPVLLPDPDTLAATDREQLTPPTADDVPPLMDSLPPGGGQPGRAAVPAPF